MQTVEQLLASPGSSDWLRAALEGSMQRDPVDAANNATALVDALNARADAKLAVDMARIGIHRSGPANT